MSDLLDDILPVAPKNAAQIVLDAKDYWMERALRAESELQALRDARPSPNGTHGYKTTCHGCGAEVTVKRRPTPSKHSWCDNCKANGEPAAQRARDYRDRKREGRSR